MGYWLSSSVVEIALLQQLLIKLTTRRVAGRSLAIGFILLFVAGLKANCCKYDSTNRNYPQVVKQSRLKVESLLSDRLKNITANSYEIFLYNF